MKTKKRKGYVGILFVCLFSLLMGLNAQAAAHPFGKKASMLVSDKMKRIVCSSEGINGCAYYTPDYKGDLKMKVTSSNPKVAKVKTYKWSYDKTKSAGFVVSREGYGTTNIKAEVTVNGKTYRKTWEYTYYKYQNPFSKLKINGKDYTSKFSQLKKKKDRNTGEDSYYNDGYYAKLGKVDGKLSYKLKSGYKIKYIMIESYSKKDENGIYLRKTIKNNQKIPKGYRITSISYEDTRKKAPGWIEVR